VGSYDDKGTGTRDGDIDPGSSKGKASDPNTWPDISAPGINILGACRPSFAICDAIGKNPKDGPGPNDIATFFVASGTSWAAPTVAGVVAMLFQVRPTATAAQIDDVLKATAYKYRNGAQYQQVGAYTSSFDKGVGLVDAYAAAVRLGARPVAGTAAGAKAAAGGRVDPSGSAGAPAPTATVQGARQSRTLAATGARSGALPAAAWIALALGLLGLGVVRRSRAGTGRGRPV
jgi:subtilisin family serine protease